MNKQLIIFFLTLPFFAGCAATGQSSSGERMYLPSTPPQYQSPQTGNEAVMNNMANAILELGKDIRNQTNLLNQALNQPSRPQSPPPPAGKISIDDIVSKDVKKLSQDDFNPTAISTKTVDNDYDKRLSNLEKRTSRNEEAIGLLDAEIHYIKSGETPPNGIDGWEFGWYRSGDYHITNEMKREMKKAAEKMKIETDAAANEGDITSYTIYVSSHTDENGTPENNKKLRQKRDEAFIKEFRTMLSEMAVVNITFVVMPGTEKNRGHTKMINRYTSMRLKRSFDQLPASPEPSAATQQPSTNQNAAASPVASSPPADPATASAAIAAGATN